MLGLLAGSTPLWADFGHSTLHRQQYKLAPYDLQISKRAMYPLTQNMPRFSFVIISNIPQSYNADDYDLVPDTAFIYYDRNELLVQNVMFPLNTVVDHGQFRLSQMQSPLRHDLYCANSLLPTATLQAGCLSGRIEAILRNNATQEDTKFIGNFSVPVQSTPRGFDVYMAMLTD